ncbi:MAG: SusC/RagA family TonB-linked outer membrane protein [Prolixibacteraceae bacterium]|jgi:TonB-linked SusC/RagA family outer membrane protein|nr:SusC/RagA family TonB-linked outer membrane protein [Prolixibacteraceae bacterium]MDI9563443.1 SusC/RagA family TonB-linked outer membrane protein [Bacteroidota bacterium]NLS98561.1 SusC/RagA family TonB-linked outer membrane protein [Bacteroidales bacterium]OQB80259.1 MAG: TonB-dependent Receptor Plug Domain protein [Bacteroidetes bacterium ADurb.Bin123]HNZ69578.1 SusC/RagA family TonB-linked outer membrane protein [Prolixibacteraceae bacterium]
MNKISLLKPVFLALVFLFSLGLASAQTAITGTVTDARDGSTLPGVNIIVAGTMVGTITDIDGNFSLTLPTDAGELVFSMVGYSTQTLPVGEATVYNVALQEATKALDEVVVIGYGTQKRSTLTGSVTKMDPKLLETGVRSNPAQALAGTIPGLRVATTTGRPGSLPTIVLRGGTNFDGSGSPLIIMDGQIRGSMSDINPEEIASIEVLKDASATAIYGARASNGVILITSKRGKSGTAQVNVKVKTGVNFLNVPYEFEDAAGYVKWARLGAEQAILNGTLAITNVAGVGPRGTGNQYKDANGNILDGNYNSTAIWSVMRLNDVNRELLQKPGWKTMKDVIKTNAAGNYDPNGEYYDLIYRDFNYGDYGLNKTAVTQDYNVSFSGGNERGKYFANLGYYDEGGLSLATFYNRLNFALNGDYKINDWLTSESGLQFARAKWRNQSLQNGETNYWARMLSAPPTLREYNENGEWILGRDASDGNPAFNIDAYKRDNQSDKFTMSQALRADIMKGLYVRVSAIMMYDESLQESFNKDFRTGIMSYTNPNTGWNRTRSSEAQFDRVIRQTYNAIANYETKFLDKNNISAMVGFEFYDSFNKGLYAAGSLAPTDDFADLGLTLNNKDQQTRSTDSWHSNERIMSGFGRVNYNYDEKYLLTMTIRRDGYSRLLGDNRYGTFPAFSLGWLMHKESFMESTGDWLSYLKLRGSWGKNGNVGGIGTYELQGSYGSQTAYNGNIGFLQTGLANPVLRWEKSNTVEVGADMGFLDNRIYASLSFYNRITDDKIASVVLPTSSGVSSIRTNNGKMRNRGVELESTIKVISKKDLKWDIGLNGAWIKNMVLQLPFNGNENNRQGGQQIYDPATGKLIWVGGYQEGKEWGEVFGFVSEGIIRTDEDLAKYNKLDLAAGQVWYGSAAGRRVASAKLIAEKGLTGWISTKKGDVMWKDIDKNDTIDYRDQVSLGRVLPRVTGGFNTTVSYKDFALAARMDFALGHIQRDAMQLWSLGCMQGEFNMTKDVRDTWTPDNPDAKYPRYVWADQLNTKNFDRPSGMFWRKSNYLAFREVTLSYNLPKSMLSRIKIPKAIISVTGQNLGYLSDRLLNLPERTGDQNGAYIIPTQLIFGLDITL